MREGVVERRDWMRSLRSEGEEMEVARAMKVEDLRVMGGLVDQAWAWVAWVIWVGG